MTARPAPGAGHRGSRPRGAGPGHCASGPAPPPAGQPADTPAGARHSRRRPRSGWPGHRAATAPRRSGLVTTWRTCAAVTCAASSPGARRRASSGAVHELRPALQRADHRIRATPGSSGAGPCPAHRYGTSIRLRRGMRLRAQPAGDIHRQHQPAIGRARQRQPGQHPAQPAGIAPAPGQRRIQTAMATAVLTSQRQLHQRPHRPIRHTALHQPAQTAHRPAVAGTGKTPGGTRTDPCAHRPGQHQAH